MGVQAAIIRRRRAVHSLRKVLGEQSLQEVVVGFGDSRVVPRPARVAVACWPGVRAGLAGTSAPTSEKRLRCATFCAAGADGGGACGTAAGTWPVQYENPIGGGLLTAITLAILVQAYGFRWTCAMPTTGANPSTVEKFLANGQH